MRRVAAWALAGLLTAGLAACGSGSTAGKAAASPATGPATAQLTYAGDPRLATTTTTDVSCGLPRLDGTTITVSQQAQGGTSLFMIIRERSIVVRFASGSGPGLQLREFSGTGTSGFDGTRGVSLSGSLSETTAPSDNKGGIGVVDSIHGVVSCGAFKPGTSTVTLSGPTTLGSLGGRLTNVVVTCGTGASGTFVTVNALSVVGGTPALLLIGLGPTSLSVAVEESQAASFLSAAPGQAGTSVSLSGGHVDGTVLEPKTSNSVRVTGDATCGTTHRY